MGPGTELWFSPQSMCPMFEWVSARQLHKRVASSEGDHPCIMSSLSLWRSTPRSSICGAQAIPKFSRHCGRSRVTFAAWEVPSPVSPSWTAPWPWCIALRCLLRLSGFGVILFDSGEAFLASFNVRCPACVVLDIHTRSGPDSISCGVDEARTEHGEARFSRSPTQDRAAHVCCVPLKQLIEIDTSDEARLR